MPAINAITLATLAVAIRTEFQDGFAGVTPQWSKFATKVNSTGSKETYAWLGDFPQMREWIGDRHRRELENRAYQVINKDFEATITIPRNKFDDDELGTYGSVARMTGQSAAENADILCFEALLKGDETECYDGQNFFDPEHSVAKVQKSNIQEGAGKPWFLLATNRPLKPIIYQERKKAQLVARTDPGSDNVFDKKQYEWGVDSREAAGYGFWQMAFMSKAELNAENYEAARAFMSELTDDEGRPLGIDPDMLVYGPADEGRARRLIVSETLPQGGTNEWQGTAELLKSPRIV